MNSRIWLAALTVCLTWVGATSAHELNFDAILTGPAESPANASPGIGTAHVFVDLDLVTMDVDVSFSGLLGTTTASHIHAATAVAGAGNAGVATQVPTFTGFPLGVTSGTYSHHFDLADASSYNPAFITANGGTVSGALNALIFAMEDGKSYLNIHTSAFPGGEIRGFLTPVPEPGTLVLAGLGAAALTACVVRRRVRASEGRTNLT